MKVLVLGDLIVDKYRMCTATRLCPEGPVPVLVEYTSPREIEKPGGAGLVAAQCEALLRKESVTFIPGGIVRKERIFADDRLMLRIDDDYFGQADENGYWTSILGDATNNSYDALIASDYGKGAFTQELAERVVELCGTKNIPLFVDAKNNFSWYGGAFAAFPNEHEKADPRYFKHIIQKLGPRGCEVDGVHIPTNSHSVRDVTGAGDCFIAAFVYKFLEYPIHERGEKWQLEMCARFANKVAGISVEFVGTHVVTKEEIDKSTNS